ncbi:MAG: hypothetical protein EA361_04300 [Bacteroidetes bacterium]|nr:MAG: hypothetical protein EA361_04300 [Bacteroidota bacterium]
MKKLILVLFLLPFFACMSQTRVVDQSGRKPGWVNGLEKDYIIVVGTGASVQDAQRNALNMVRENIVNAVAQNVRATSELSTEEANFNNNISVYLERFATTISSASGPVPYLQGITLSKVDEFYWEKLQDRNTRAETYHYHIKYPFPNIELQKLVMDFRIRDRELTEQLDNILASVDDISSIEDIEKNIGELHILSDYFVDARRDKARLGITRYRNLYNTIELVEQESSPGELKYAVRFGNRYVTTSQRPQVTSECARVTGTSSQDYSVVIKYDYMNCYEDPENHLLVRYRFGNNNVQKRFYFDTTTEKASVFVNGPIHFTSVSRNESSIESSKVSITIVSRYDAPFTIDKLELEWPGHAPVIISNIGQRFAGKGNHNLTLEIKQPIQAEIVSTLGRNVSLMSGRIHYKSDRTGEMKTYRMFNQNYTTNW